MSARIVDCKNKMITLRPLHRIIILPIIFSLLLFGPRTPAVRAADTIDKGRNITDGGGELVSAGRTFTLGFFSPAGSLPTRRYLGIWFTVSPGTVYWVANRDHPLNDTSGVLVMSNSGSLLLLDGSGNEVWSSGATSSPATGARLLETGNLVVLGQGDGKSLWQAFDHPCNNLLPGMKIGKNLWTGAEWSLSSWRSAADPAPGSYRYITDAARGGMAENVLRDGNGTRRYRTGPWNGKRFNGVPEMSFFADKFDFRLTDSDGEMTYGYTAKGGAPYSRVTLTDDGHVQRLVWDAGSRQWNQYFKAPRDDCDIYGTCGPFGQCDSVERSTSICRCVQGFSPVSQSEWSNREYSRGCRRSVALDCGNRSWASTDEFEVLRGVKLPDTRDAVVNKSISLDQCRARCLANCSCVAYAAADLRGGGDGTGCILWINSFLDLRLIDDGQDFYLRLEKSEVSQGGKKKRKLLVPMFAVIVWRRRTKPRHHVPITGPIPGLIIPSIDYEIIKTATGNFTATTIGEGNFGTVYQCELPIPDNESTRAGIPVSTNVAVKVLKQSDIDSYKRELTLMSRLSHVYLLRLLAYCNDEIHENQNQRTDEKARILVYEYMERGSLDTYIFDTGVKRAKLDWEKRLEIITCIAQGIMYLHVGCGKEIIHRDLKPANILLADDWTPKIADFGLAKHITDPNELHTAIVSYGYSAPETWPEGKITDKSDVYSFGVALLEIISGRRNGFMQELLPHAWNAWNKGCILMEKLVDLEVPPSLEQAHPELLSRIKRCIQIGMLCVQKPPEKRPHISEVVEMLKGQDTMPTPQEPTLREQGEPSNARHTDDHTQPIQPA